ncbi:MAG: hypothetical protein H6Q90_5228 [Deltaproteobacteria bacterium]|nr:hypothetical protein [Deltaproteobacteria bacterium]
MANLNSPMATKTILLMSLLSASCVAAGSGDGSGDGKQDCAGSSCIGKLGQEERAELNLIASALDMCNASGCEPQELLTSNDSNKVLQAVYPHGMVVASQASGEFEILGGYLAAQDWQPLAGPALWLPVFFKLGPLNDFEEFIDQEMFDTHLKYTFRNGVIELTLVFTSTAQDGTGWIVTKFDLKGGANTESVPEEMFDYLTAFDVGAFKSHARDNSGVDRWTFERALIDVVPDPNAAEKIIKVSTVNPATNVTTALSFEEQERIVRDYRDTQLPFNLDVPRLD